MRNYKTGTTQIDYASDLLYQMASSFDFHIVSCDSSGSFRLRKFKNKFPNRLHEVGAAEACSLAIACGLSSPQRRVIICGFSSFLLFRGFEVIRSLISYHNFNVLILGGMAGFSHGKDGFMHQNVEDIGLMKLLPNIQIFVPSDNFSIKECLNKSLITTKPTYLRITRTNVVLKDHEENRPVLPFRLCHNSGKKVAIISYGFTLPIAISTAEILDEAGIGSTVFDISCHRPLTLKLTKLLPDFELCLTIEDHLISSGIASDIKNIFTGPLIALGIEGINQLRSGTNESLLDHFGMTPQKAVNKILKFFKEKSNV